MPQLPVTQPLGGPSVSGTSITVDVLTKPVTRIAPIIRDLVRENEGYFAEDIFNTPGMTIQGGAVIYQETFPEDHFLDPDQSIAPRAPGSEAPIVGAFRGAPKIARPESWAGQIEVTDEARRRNDVATVQAAFRKAANTFADRIQTRAVETLNTAITAWGRTISGGNWRAALTNGPVNADPLTLPHRDFSLVLTQFANDKAGVRPDLIIMHPDDAFYLDVIYGEKLPALFDRYNLTPLVSPEQTEGQVIFAKRGQVGTMAFEKPLDTEYERLGRRKTDAYILEATPVFVAIDAASVIRLEGVDS